jgi:apolipoprotein D and lipocalin family protein
MQFLWPIKAEFLVVYLDDSYERTIIGRSKRDYIWLMAREPELTPMAYQELLDAAAAAGYDVNRIRKVPQRWPEKT